MQQAPQSARALVDEVWHWGPCLIVPPPCNDSGSGLQIFGARASAVEGRNMERKMFRESWAELSFSVGKVEYREGTRALDATR